ncbi:MAG: formate dehydrogenase subunit gamma [Burkholderiales bacterium]|nr:formate dehydrogenase subunit gamma [Burkholderiales bacterium]
MMSRAVLGALAHWLLVLTLASAGAAWADEKQPYVTPPPSSSDQRTINQVERQQTQPYNNAPLWREVRSGDAGVTQVKGIETGVLVQPQGETWRALRNGPVIFYGGILLLVVPAAILLFFAWRGPLKTHSPPSGRLIQRFTSWERLIHWLTAISFVVLALSGILMLFGKYIVLPLFGYTLFSWIAIVSKNLHNFVGPLFVFCTLLMFFTFVGGNFWRIYDWKWIKKGGGMVSGEHVPAGKYNAGEKLWFWGGVTLLGIVVSASGLILNFPNFDQGRGLMQQANIVHGVAALFYMAASLGHIYLGTIGMQGAYRSMRHGTVDETWAKEHHEYWYDDLKAGKAVATPPTHSKPGPRAQPQHG